MHAGRERASRSRAVGKEKKKWLAGHVTREGRPVGHLALREKKVPMSHEPRREAAVDDAGKGEKQASRSGGRPRDSGLEAKMGHVVVGPCCGSLLGLIWAVHSPAKRV